MPTLNHAWSLLLQLFALLGGATGIMKIIEWLLSKPKIIGQVERTIITGYVRNLPDGSNESGTHFLLLVYLTNGRIKPTTIRTFELVVEIDGKKLDARPMLIEPVIKLEKQANIDWQTAPRLYDIAPFNVVEWGKGMRGWLRFLLAGADWQKVTSGAKLTLILTDPMNRTYRIRYVTGKHSSDHLSYVPGAGFRF
jgi:hypothetical protein